MEHENQNSERKPSLLNKEFDLNLLFTVLKKNKFFPFILIFISLSFSFIYLRYTKPVYESSAVIQRSSLDEGKRILDIESFEQESDLSVDVELLKSTFLLEKALRNLKLEISYFSEGEILTEEKYLMSSYHITLLDLKDSSLVGKPIFVKKVKNGVKLTFSSAKGEQTINVVPNELVENEFFSLIFKINNETLFTEGVAANNLYFVFNDYAYLTKKMHPKLQVFALNPEASTIKVVFRSNNHKLSKDVVNSVINTFFQYDLDKKRKSSANVLDFIDSQLDTVFVQLKASEVAIQSFKDGNAVTDPEYITTKILERSSVLQDQLIEVEYELELISEVEKSVLKNDRIEIYKIIPAVTGTEYESLLIKELEELHKLLVVKEDLLYSVKESTDQYKNAEKDINQQSDNIFRIIGTVKKQLKFRKDIIQERVFKEESKLFGIPEKEMELSRLNRMFDLNEKYYTLLIEKKTQYAISKAGYTMDNMILQAPSDAVLISPNKKLVYLGSFVFAIIISIIFLLIRYLTFNDIHEAEELKRLMPSSVGFVGAIPNVVTSEKNSTLMVHKSPKSILAESYRHMRTNLQFILKQNTSNVIAVSSSVSGEGKTFVAINLAGIIAMTGKKVLVIDLDLRKPKIHLAFDFDNKSGMSSILSKNIKWKDCVRPAGLENLDVITAGPVPPNPSELIIGDVLDGVIEELKQEYDIIIIDNPPVGIVSDGISILNKADCPIYVFRANYSKRYFVQRVRELVDTKQVAKLFVVLNGQEMGRKGKYGYGYGEYYSDDAPKKKWQFWKK